MFAVIAPVSLDNCEAAAAADGPTGQQPAQQPAQLTRQQQGAGDWRAPADRCELRTTAEWPAAAPYPYRGKGAGGYRARGASRRTAGGGREGGAAGRR